MHVAAHGFDHNLMFQQTLAHSLWICAVLIDLIDRNNHRHICSLSMLNGFNRLGHEAIISSDHQNDNVGHRSAALTHLRKCFMAWRIEEGDDCAILCLHLIGADMLRNTARFA